MRSIRAKVLAGVLGAIVAVGLCGIAYGAGAPAVEQQIPFKQGEPSLGRAWVAIIVLLALAAGGAYLARRYLGLRFENRKHLGDGIEIVGSRRLSTKTVIHLIQLDSKPLLLVETGDTVKIVEVDGKELSGSSQNK